MKILTVLRVVTLIAVPGWAVACDAPPVEGEGEEGEEGEGEGEEGEGEVFGDGGLGDTCSFNADCGAGLRCGCDEGAGCFCEQGARGTAPLGDNCIDENDCASAVCLEDANDVFACSAACVDDGDCVARLPICSDVAFVGRICIRDPNG